MMEYLVKSGRRSGVQSGLPLLSDFDRVMDRVFGAQPRRDLQFPAVDVREEDDKYVVEAELPGLTEQDVSVHLEDNLLVIESEKQEEETSDGPSYLYRERRQKSFRRAFSLPKDVDRESIEALFTNGLLVLSLSKLPEAKPREIKIKKA